MTLQQPIRTLEQFLEKGGDADAVIILGDLNYRLNLSNAQKVRHLVHLTSVDQKVTFK